MPKYEFRGDGLSVRVTQPSREGGISLYIEHESGAALIVPSADAVATQDGLRARVSGFDGTSFEVALSGDHQRVEITASTPSPILGGRREAIATRRTDLEGPRGPVRVTGDESTMPIDVDE